MSPLSRSVSVLLYVALGVGLLALVAWELRLGFAAGTFGGAALAARPGTFWFVVAAQVALALVFFGAAGQRVHPHRSSRRIVRLVLAVLLVLGAWTVWETVAAFAGLVMSVPAPDRWFDLVLGIVLTGVMVTLGYEMIWTELTKRS